MEAGISDLDLWLAHRKLLLTSTQQLCHSLEGAGQLDRQAWSRRGGAGGGSWTHTGLAALRIFLPSTAFAALTSQVCGLDYPFTLLRNAGG